MLLKLFNRFRTDEASAREFVERDELDIDRRMAVIRDLNLSDEELAIVLREETKEGIELIKKQIASSDLALVLKLGTLKDAEEKHLEVVKAIEDDINKWIADISAWHAWPGRPGPFIAHVSPAVIDEQDVIKGPVELEIQGLLFNPIPNKFPKMVFYRMGSNSDTGSAVATVDSVNLNPKYPHTAARVKVEFERLAAGENVRTYDLLIDQNGDSKFPTGHSRFAAAVTVCRYQVKFPKP